MKCKIRGGGFVCPTCGMLYILERLIFDQGAPKEKFQTMQKEIVSTYIQLQYLDTLLMWHIYAFNFTFYQVS